VSSWYRYTNEVGDIVYECDCGHEILVPWRDVVHQPRYLEIAAAKQRTHEQEAHRPRDPVLEQEC